MVVSVHAHDRLHERLACDVADIDQLAVHADRVGGDVEQLGLAE